MKAKSLLRVIAILSVTVSFISCTGGGICSVKRIWGGDKYCAFTSLAEYEGRFYCTFREGESHIFDKDGIAAGRIRVISSRDGKKWKSVALLSKEGYDLRDPKICVTPEGTLMLIMGGSIYRDRKLEGAKPQVSFSKDGKSFSDPQPAVFEDGLPHDFDWLWDIKWQDGTGYSVSYGKGEERILRLYKTGDGVHFSLVADLASDIGTEDFPNETAIDFLPDGRMALMVRCDDGDRLGWWGTAAAPFTEWEWTRMQYELGGPDFIPYKDGIIAGSRLYLPSRKTAVYTGNDEGWIIPEMILPSDGDTSYPGLLLKGDELWVSYYSTHENRDKASIYLARIPLKSFTNVRP